MQDFGEGGGGFGIKPLGKLGHNVKLYWMNLFFLPYYSLGNATQGCGSVLAWKVLRIKHNLHIPCCITVDLHTLFNHVTFDANGFPLGLA
jgi:hypothetical protein